MGLLQTEIQMAEKPKHNKTKNMKIKNNKRIRRYKRKA